MSTFVIRARGFVLEGFCPRGFCPRGVLSVYRARHMVRAKDARMPTRVEIEKLGGRRTLGRPQLKLEGRSKERPRSMKSIEADRVLG